MTVACTETDPDKPAIVMSDGSGTLSFAMLDRRSIQIARRLAEGGLAAGDRVALLMDNDCDHVAAAWAARRSELRFVPVNWHLKRDEAAYIVEDSDAAALIVSDRLRGLAGEIASEVPAIRLRLASGARGDGFDGLDHIYATTDATPLAGQREGGPMPYSSGTTGRPKGILRPLSGKVFPAPTPVDQLIRDEYGFGPDTVYLSPAPLYHAAPMTWTMGAQLWGGTAIVMPAFDAEAVLQAIERRRVTYGAASPMSSSRRSISFACFACPTR